MGRYKTNLPLPFLNYVKDCGIPSNARNGQNFINIITALWYIGAKTTSFTVPKTRFENLKIFIHHKMVAI